MMKKISIFLLIVVGIVSTVYYIYINQLNINRIAKKENGKFEFYQNEIINGEQLATVINKAIDHNIKNNVKKDNKGMFIDNENNSINIDIHFIDSNVVLNMETVQSGGIDKFLSYYKNIEFKCQIVQYHDKTNKIKYMIFEQITQ